MGYTTDFTGAFFVTPVLKLEHAAYLRQFASVRHMQWNEEKLAIRDDKCRMAVGLPIGPQGAFFTGGADDDSMYDDTAIISINLPPGMPRPIGDDWLEKQRAAIEAGAVPSLWCQWTPNDDGTAIVWDGGEKFYKYKAWIVYLLKNFLVPWGYKLSGDVYWHGADAGDVGLIRIRDNVVEIVDGEVPKGK